MRKRYSVTAIALLLLMAACTQSQLDKTKTALSDMTSAVQAAQTIVITLNKGGVIDDATTNKIMIVFVKIDSTKIQIDQIVNGLKASTIDKPTAQSIIALIKTIDASVQSLVNDGTAGIKDPATKAKVNGAILVLQTALGALQIALSGS